MTVWVYHSEHTYYDVRYTIEVRVFSEYGRALDYANSQIFGDHDEYDITEYEVE